MTTPKLPVTRREFLKTGAAASLATLAFPYILRGQSGQRPS